LIDFPIDGDDGIGWRTYRFEVQKEGGLVIDLKMLIEKDFGFNIKEQQLYFNFKLLEDDNTPVEVLIRDTDITTRKYLTLIFIPKG
jgi:hypothetical protein